MRIFPPLVRLVLICATAATAAPRTFTNPLLPSGPDPWVIRRDGFYYYMHTTARNLTIWKTRSMADLATAPSRVVWIPPDGMPYSHDLWAPELHYLQGRWYIYFAADAGTNRSHRLWVLENPSQDPLEGEWTLKGKLSDPGDHWAIDGTVLEDRGRLYLIWSGWAGADNGAQNLYIAELENPWTMKGDRVRLSTPQFPWEKVGDLEIKRDPDRNPGTYADDPLHIDINEGPEVLRHGNRIFVVYSASACWTEHYQLGMLWAAAGSNLLDPASWKKSRLPVFWESPSAGAYGPGHNSFFQSPDGKEDWILYHANTKPGQGCGPQRAPRVQPFNWRSDGMPDFGRPAPIQTPLERPSGE